MGTVRTDEFRKDAVRIALSSKDQDLIRGIKLPEDGLTRRQLADDLGVGMSTLNKWITAHSDTDVVSKEDLYQSSLILTHAPTASVRWRLFVPAFW